MTAFAGDLAPDLAQAGTKRRHYLPPEPPGARWPSTNPEMMGSILRGLREE